MQRSDLKYLGLLALVFFGVFISGHQNEFVLDSQPIVRDNPRVHEGDIGAAWSTDWWNRPAHQVPATLYRPIPMTWLILLGEGDDPVAYNLGNLLLHIGVAVARFWLLLLLLGGMTGGRAIAFFVAMAAGLHGISAESVVGVVGVAELFMSLFLTVSWACFTLHLQKRGPAGGMLNLGLAAAFWFCALLSKENAAMFPVVLFVHALIGVRGEDEAAAPTWRPLPALVAMTPFVAMLGAWIGIRVGVLGELTRFEGASVYEGFTTVERITSSLAVMGAHYLPKLLWPFGLMPNLTHQDVVPPSGFGDLRVLAGVVAWLAVVAWCVVGLRRRSVAGLMGLVFVVTLFPTSNLVVSIGALGAYRFLYTPLFALVTAAAIGVASMSTTRPAAMRWGVSALVIWAIVGAVGASRLVTVWKDDATLFAYSLELNPNSVWALQNDTWTSYLTDPAKSTPERLAAARRFDDVEPHLARIPTSNALDADTQMLCSMILGNWASFCMRVAGTDKAIFDEAKAVAERARGYAGDNEVLQFKGYLLESEVRLGEYSSWQGRRIGQSQEYLDDLIDTAENLLVQAERIRSDDITKEDRAILQHNYFKIALLRKDEEAAEHYLAAALKIDPGSPAIRMQAADRAQKKGDMRGALGHVQAALEDERATSGIAFTGYQLALQLKDRDLAFELLKKASRLRAESPEEAQQREQARKLLRGGR